MPAQLTFNILAYFAALSLPATWRRFLHPVLVSAGITILGVWILGLMRGDSLTRSLDAYRTHTTYLSLWNGDKGIPPPGAGDILVSVLDAGIVALALPMFSYRLELKRHFFAIVIPNVTVSIGSLFVYPPLCYAVGISAKRALAFPVRSLTLALATPAAQNLGGDANTASALAIMSGILGALIGPQMLDRLKIPDGEFKSPRANPKKVEFSLVWTLCDHLLVLHSLMSIIGLHIWLVNFLASFNVVSTSQRKHAPWPWSIAPPASRTRLTLITDDYVTRGVTLGGSSSAIVTAVLLQSDPRAAALSSLSMSLFGIITLALTSVPVIVKAVNSLVGI